jgi:hypothetical protein
MMRSLLFACCAVAAALVGLPDGAHAQPASPFGGIWTLNRSVSEFPPEIGFNPAWMTQGAASADGQPSSSGGGRGRRGSSGGGGGGGRSPFSSHQESYEDARRAQLLTAEARNPPTRLTIVDTPSAVTMTNELGQSRVLHPDGKEETLEIQGMLFGVTSRRDGDQLIVVYRVEQSREVRFTYAHTENPSRLVVDVQFLEKNAGDKARRVYDAGMSEVRPTTSDVRPTSSDAPGAPAHEPAPEPASGQKLPENFDRRPNAELIGLKSVGIVVEDLSQQAAKCGLSHDTIESAVSKRLSDGGFTVRRNSDEDTYVYVNIMTNSLPDGTCVSRYDAFLYTQGTATLSYRDRPVLVQVSLMHRGGIGTSAPAAHAASVTRGLQGYIDLFVTQIRDANK